MLGVINDRKAKSIFENYFSLIEKTGYVKHKYVCKLLVYAFLLDFVENAFMFMTEEDYMIIDKYLHKLFADGGCLLPYPIFCANRAILGLNGFMGRRDVRITEDASGNIDRITENELHRVV